MASIRFQVQPASVRQRCLATFTDFEQTLSAIEVASALGLASTRSERLRVAATLHELAKDGYLVKVGQAPREGNYGRPWRTFRRVAEPQTAQLKRFTAARKIVEDAGFVLVPRRAL